MNDERKKSGPNRPVLRDAQGHFLPGTAPGPGRRKAIDLRAVVEREAFVEGVSLEEALWRVVKKLIAQAEAGCTQSAKIVLDRLTGPLEDRGPLVGIALQQQVNAPPPDVSGPPVPQGSELVDYFRKLADQMETARPEPAASELPQAPDPSDLGEGELPPGDPATTGFL